MSRLLAFRVVATALASVVAFNFVSAILGAILFSGTAGSILTSILVFGGLAYLMFFSPYVETLVREEERQRGTGPVEDPMAPSVPGDAGQDAS